MQVLQDAQPSSAAADAVHTRHRQLRVERSAGAVCISQEQEIAEQLDVCLSVLPYSIIT